MVEARVGGAVRGGDLLAQIEGAHYSEVVFHQHQNSVPQVSLVVVVDDVEVDFVDVVVHEVVWGAGFALGLRVPEAVGGQSLASLVVGHVVVYFTFSAHSGGGLDLTVGQRRLYFSAGDGVCGGGNQKALETLHAALFGVILITVGDFVGHIDGDALSGVDVVSRGANQAGVVLFDPKAVLQI